MQNARRTARQAARGFAQGMVWLFARWGGAIAPLMMMLLVYPAGWRGGFIFISLLGLVWAFFRNFRDTLAQGPQVNESERAFIAASLRLQERGQAKRD